jgi:O-antigen/teichoic acid export membrane protein
MQPLNFLSKHRVFVGNVATMMSGKTAAAAIALLTTPVVARLYEPGDFGVAAAFLAIVGMVSNVGSLRYESALVLPKGDDEAITVMALAYRILFLVCIAMLVFLGLYRLLDLEIAALDILGNWMWLLPLAVLLSSALNIQESWLARKKKFKVVAASTAIGTGVNSGSRIGFGALSGSTVYGLIFGNIFGMTSRLVIQKTASIDGAKAIFHRYNLSSLQKVAKDYFDFPKLNAPAGFVFSVGQNLPVLLFGIMFSPAAAGFYSMANRLSQAPVSIVSMSMRRVFYQKAAEVHNRGASLQKAFVLASGGLALLGAVPFLLLWLYGQPILTVLLGDRWIDAGRYLEIMAPWLFMIWVAAPTHAVFIVLRKQSAWLVLQVWLTFARLAAFGLAYYLSASPEWALGAFVVTTVGCNLIMVGMSLSLIARQDHERRVGHVEASSAPDEDIVE